MTRRPSVLVTASTYPRWADDSHPRFVHDLSARLAERFDVTVIAPGSHGAAGDEVVDGVHVKRIRYWRDRPDLLCDGAALPTIRRRPSTALQVPGYLATHFRAVRRELASGAYDTVHANWILPQGALAELARRRAVTPSGQPVRLVVTSHGADVFGLDPLAFATRWTLRRTDAFTGVSEAVVSRARELGLPDEVEQHVAPMGIDTSLFHPDEKARHELRTQLGVSGPLVLFAGRLSEKKGVDVLLDAADRLRRTTEGLQVAILGTGEDEARLQQRATSLDLDDIVTFHGFRPHAELARWYAAADVFVGPSVVARGGDTEGFGLVFAEALAAGCPVVASDLPAIRDIVDGTTVGLLATPGQAASLADKLATVLADPAAWRARAAADVTRVKDRWGWAAVTDRYAKILVPES